LGEVFVDVDECGKSGVGDFGLNGRRAVFVLVQMDVNLRFSHGWLVSCICWSVEGRILIADARTYSARTTRGRQRCGERTRTLVGRIEDSANKQCRNLRRVVCECAFLFG
jgi:hypothetical protein